MILVRKKKKDKEDTEIHLILDADEYGQLCSLMRASGVGYGPARDFVTSFSNAKNDFNKLKRRENREAVS